MRSYTAQHTFHCGVDLHAKTIHVCIFDGADSGTEPENRSPDWVVDNSLGLELRAERLGEGPGRTYTIEVGCCDEAGNEVTGTVTVDVPHDQR